MHPARCRHSGSGRCVDSRAPLARGRFTLAAGVLAGALVVSAGAAAQDGVGAIEKRIENTFDLVIGNTADLAIPLTRRALARRSAEDKAMEPLPYRDTTPGLDPSFAPLLDQPIPEGDTLTISAAMRRSGTAETWRSRGCRVRARSSPTAVPPATA